MTHRNENIFLGYILGLGDRHISNILIDKSSAEVVHIDLGIAFDQGRLLPTPELVPFRLTRDIVDAMGVTGTEGVFRRCCEETLSVLREHRESLLTIMEVFLHDPLYQWALTPALASRKQNTGVVDLASTTTNTIRSRGNRDAEKVLRRVGQKLQGIESTGVVLSVSNLLIW